MNLIVSISSSCGREGRGPKNPKILWMSLMDAPLAGLCENNGHSSHLEVRVENKNAWSRRTSS